MARGSVVALALVLLAGETSAASFVIDKTFNSRNFDREFKFLSSPRPSQTRQGRTSFGEDNGFSRFLDATQAREANITRTVSDGYHDYVYMGVDHDTILDPEDGVGRDTFRVQSVQSFKQGLFVTRFKHLPKPVCGSWPSFFTLGDEQALNGGEIHLYDGWNLNKQNTIGLHVGARPKAKLCELVNSEQGARLVRKDCDKAAGSQYAVDGCQVEESRDGILGTSEGGTQALLWTSDEIKVYTWLRGSEPDGLDGGEIDPGQWTTRPSLHLRLCNVDAAFQAQRLMLDISFCGAAAEPRFWGEHRKGSPDSCFARTGGDSCAAYVAKNPRDFRDSYFSIRDIRYFRNLKTEGTSLSGGLRSQLVRREDNSDNINDNNPSGDSNPPGSNPYGSNPTGSNQSGSNPPSSNPPGSNLSGDSNPSGSNPGSNPPGGSNPGSGGVGSNTDSGDGGDGDDSNPGSGSGGGGSGSLIEKKQDDKTVKPDSSGGGSGGPSEKVNMDKPNDGTDKGADTQGGSGTSGPSETDEGKKDEDGDDGDGNADEDSRGVQPGPGPGNPGTQMAPMTNSIAAFWTPRPEDASPAKLKLENKKQEALTGSGISEHLPSNGTAPPSIPSGSNMPEKSTDRIKDKSDAEKDPAGYSTVPPSAPMGEKPKCQSPKLFPPGSPNKDVKPVFPEVIHTGNFTTSPPDFISTKTDADASASPSQPDWAPTSNQPTSKPESELKPVEEGPSDPQAPVGPDHAVTSKNDNSSSLAPGVDKLSVQPQVPSGLDHAVANVNDNSSSLNSTSGVASKKGDGASKPSRPCKVRHKSNHTSLSSDPESRHRTLPQGMRFDVMSSDSIPGDKGSLSPLIPLDLSSDATTERILEPVPANKTIPLPGSVDTDSGPSGTNQTLAPAPEPTSAAPPGMVAVTVYKTVTSTQTACPPTATACGLLPNVVVNVTSWFKDVYPVLSVAEQTLNQSTVGPDGVRKVKKVITVYRIEKCPPMVPDCPLGSVGSMTATKTYCDGQDCTPAATERARPNVGHGAAPVDMPVTISTKCAGPACSVPTPAAQWGGATGDEAPREPREDGAPAEAGQAPHKQTMTVTVVRCDGSDKDCTPGSVRTVVADAPCPGPECAAPLPTPAPLANVPCPGCAPSQETPGGQGEAPGHEGSAQTQPVPDVAIKPSIGGDVTEGDSKLDTDEGAGQTMSKGSTDTPGQDLLPSVGNSTATPLDGSEPPETTSPRLSGQSSDVDSDEKPPAGAGPSTQENPTLGPSGTSGPAKSFAKGAKDTSGGEALGSQGPGSSASAPVGQGPGSNAPGPAGSAPPKMPRPAGPGSEPLRAAASSAQVDWRLCWGVIVGAMLAMQL